MINLIPIEEKKKMNREFYLRFTIVCLFALSFAVLIAAGSILPSYFFASVKKNVIDEKIQHQNNIPLSTPDIETLAVVSGVNKKLQIIENAKKGTFSVSERIINEIILKKMSDIKITQITYEDNTLEGKKIHISGSAPSREELLRFRLALEDNPAFKNVNLPVSNFVKGSDIKFFVTLIAS